MASLAEQPSAPARPPRSIRPYLGWALVLLGIGALGAHQGDFERMDAWGWVAIAAFAAAPFIGMRRSSALRWLLASFPFWAFGETYEWMLLVAVGLVIASLAQVALIPTLVGRRVNRSAAQATPLPHLANGPLIAVTPAVFAGGQRSRALRYASIVLVLIAAGLFVALAMGGGPEIAALLIAAVIIAATFAFGNWFADRVRVRVDETGVHGRVMFLEHTARWTEISGLRLRYLFLPGYSARLVYYVVESPTHEVAFPSSMRGAKDLQATIEAATGLKWPEPEITATM
jgi:hypothetical protein